MPDVHAVGTKKNPLNQMVLWAPQKHVLTAG